MQEAAWPLGSWEVFYLILGSSAAALIGLQFVVIVLGADLGTLGGTSAVRAFGTPTIVHFSAVLLLSALVSAPWHQPSSAAIALGVFGATGVTYMLRVVGHARRQTSYAPDLEDWTWHGALPLIAYATLLVAAFVFPRHPLPSLFVIGAAVALLLFVGIHNAWDAVIYIARGHMRDQETPAVAAPKRTEDVAP